jgi:hypothetical protein
LIRIGKLADQIVALVTSPSRPPGFLPRTRGKPDGFVEPSTGSSVRLVNIQRRDQPGAVLGALHGLRDATKPFESG